MPAVDVSTQTPPPRPPADVKTAFLVVDTESVPDGGLVSRVKYDGALSDEAAIERFRAELSESSWNKSDFIPVTFQVPVAVCVLRVGADFGLQNIACLDAPQYRPAHVVRKFWAGLGYYKAKLVTFNGRGFDMPLMELAALRYGVTAAEYCQGSRNRFNGPLDLCEWISNFGACRLAGGLNLLAKMLGKPGKMGVAGDQVYDLHRAGKLDAINGYCLCDTLDTYFVFLRTRVFTGDITLDREAELVDQARALLLDRTAEFPALAEYLAAWA